MPDSLSAVGSLYMHTMNPVGIDQIHHAITAGVRLHVYGREPVFMQDHHFDELPQFSCKGSAAEIPLLQLR